jgi:hypothetical protein
MSSFATSIAPTGWRLLIVPSASLRVRKNQQLKNNGYSPRSVAPADSYSANDSSAAAVAVVAADEVDLASVDATSFINHCEVGGLRLADDAVGRGWTAVGHRVADLNLGVARSRSVLAVQATPLTKTRLTADRLMAIIHSRQATVGALDPA